MHEHPLKVRADKHCVYEQKIVQIYCTARHWKCRSIPFKHFVGTGYKNISNTAQEEQIFFDRVFSRTISKRTEGSITKTTYRRAS